MKIIIQGYAAEGKTTIAKLITDTLVAHGINVKNEDLDVQTGHDYPHLQDARVEALVDKNTKIAIEVVQIRRH